MASLATQGPGAPDFFSGLLRAASTPANQSSGALVGNGSAAGPGAQAIAPFQSLQLVHQLKGLIVLLYSIVVVVGLVGNCLLVLVIDQVTDSPSGEFSCPRTGTQSSFREEL